MEVISTKEEEMNLPVLNGIIDFLNRFGPNKLMQQHLIYDFQKSREENKTIELFVLINQVKRSLIGMYPEDKDYIKKLIDERDVYNIHNTQSGKENFFIQYYNKKVIETLNYYWDYIIERFSIHPDFKQSGKELLNMGMIKPIFKLWYDVFDVNEIGNELKSNESLNCSLNDEQIKKILDLIDPHMQQAFWDYENNIPDKVLQWKNNEDKKSCATFCIFLFDNGNYFVPNKLTTAKKFALGRYHNDFSVMIDKLRKKVNKSELEKETTKIKRLILKKPYGTI